MSSPKLNQARISDDHKYIIDSQNRRVEYNDPRVVHVWPIATGKFTTRMFKNAFEKRGWNFRFISEPSREGFQYSKKICSGRECLSCLSISGETFRDIDQNRRPEDITVYYNFDSANPCQSGAWPAVWDAFADRLNLENTVFMGSTTLDNNYMGQGKEFAKDLIKSVVIGDFLEEAEFALKVLAKDRHNALDVFEEENEKIFESLTKDFKELGAAISGWAGKMAKIEKKATVEQTPKVFIFGGMGLMFFHHSISEYFVEQGILPKVEEVTFGLSFIQCRHLLLYGLKRGMSDPKDHFDKKSVMWSLPFNNFKKGFNAVKAGMIIEGIDKLATAFKNAAWPSGLLSHRHIPFAEIAKTGHEHISYSTNNETPSIVGLYASLAKRGDFDGLANAAHFSCMPSMNAQGIIRSLATQNDIPFAAIDCDGPALSANHLRLLETLAVQARQAFNRKVR